MNKQERWFDNPFPDYQPNTEFTVDKEELKRQGLELLELACSKGSQDGDGGIYVGALGITYTYLHVAHLLTDEEKQRFLALAQKAFQNQTTYHEQHQSAKTDLCSFLLGKGGFFAVGAVFGNESGNQEDFKQFAAEYVQAAHICKPLKFFRNGGDELFVGRAGYLCGALWMQQKLGHMPVPKQDLLDVWNSIIESGQKYSQQHKSPCPLMFYYYDTEYLGAAHGLCSIIQMLLSFPGFLKLNHVAENQIKTTLDYYLTLQDSHGNFPCAMDEIRPGRTRNDSDMLLHWCHGAPGAIYMFAKAYLHFQDEKYLNACIKCGEVVWARGLLRKGPGICHGIAGNGYVFLVIYNLLNQKEPKYLYRAVKFAEFLKGPQFLQEAKRPDSPYSLYEGIAGTACFVLDLLQPEKAEFPFFNLNNNYNDL